MHLDCKFFLPSSANSSNDMPRCLSEEKYNELTLRNETWVLTCDKCKFYERGPCTASSKSKSRKVKAKVTLDTLYEEIKKEGTIKVKLLSVKLGISPPNLYSKIRKLEERGLVQKVKPGEFKVHGN